MGVGIKGGYMELGVEDFNLGIGLNIAGCDFTLAGSADINGFGTVAVNLEDNILKVKDYLGNILLTPGIFFASDSISSWWSRYISFLPTAGKLYSRLISIGLVSTQ